MQINIWRNRAPFSSDRLLWVDVLLACVLAALVGAALPIVGLIWRALVHVAAA